MLQPARTKYRKQMKGRMKGLAYRGSDLSFGEYGLKALAHLAATDRSQPEAGVRASVLGPTQ